MLVACFAGYIYWLRVALIKYFSCFELDKATRHDGVVAYVHMYSIWPAGMCVQLSESGDQQLPFPRSGSDVRRSSLISCMCVCSRGMSSLLVTSLSACKAGRRDWRGPCGRWIPNVSVAVTVWCKKIIWCVFQECNWQLVCLLHLCLHHFLLLNAFPFMDYWKLNNYMNICCA